MSENFQYEPLKTSEHHIRILRVLPPTDPSAPIQCILTSNPHRRSTYSALSYAWGDDLRRHKIIVNGKNFLIHSNLYGFLKHAQNKLSNKPLWVDAICINQQNYTEKGHQVQYMRQIYQQAKTVIIWLHAESTFSTPQDDTQDQSIRSSAIHCIEDWACTTLINYITPLRSKSRLPLSSLELAMRELLAHTYWSRMWVIQEAWLASSVTVYWNGLKLRWNALQAVISSIEYDLLQEVPTRFLRHFKEEHLISLASFNLRPKNWLTNPSLPTDSQPLKLDDLLNKFSPEIHDPDLPDTDFPQVHGSRNPKLGDLILQYTKNLRTDLFPAKRLGKLELADLVFRYTNQCCHDHRDKIYALLGIASNGDDFLVDYSEQMLPLLFRFMDFCWPEGVQTKLFKRVFDCFMDPQMGIPIESYAIFSEENTMPRYRAYSRASYPELTEAILIQIRGTELFMILRPSRSWNTPDICLALVGISCFEGIEQFDYDFSLNSVFYTIIDRSWYKSELQKHVVLCGEVPLRMKIGFGHSLRASVADMLFIYNNSERVREVNTDGTAHLVSRWRVTAEKQSESAYRQLEDAIFAA